MKKTLVLSIFLAINVLYAQNVKVKQPFYKQMLEKNKVNKKTFVPTQNSFSTERTKGQTELNYNWDLQNSEWLLADTSYYTYTPSGKISSKILVYNSGTSFKYLYEYNAEKLVSTQEFYKVNQDWEPINKTTYTYNAINNKPSEVLKEDYINNNWEVDYREVYNYDYDSFNQLNSYTYEYYDGNTLENTLHVVLNYNINHLPSLMEFLDDNYEPVYKYELGYSGSNTDPDIIDIYEWYSNNWEYVINAQNITYRNFTIEQLITEDELDFLTLDLFEYDPDLDELLPVQKMVKEYDIYDGYIAITQFYDSDNEIWVNGEKDELINNEYREKISLTYFDWTGSNWIDYFIEEYVYTTDNDDNVIEIERSIYYNQNLNNRNKSVYSNFVEITGIAKQASVLELVVYPNPTTGILQIKTTNQDIEEIKIFDTMGRVVFNSNTNTQNISLDTTPFPVGVYVLELKTNTGKIIREKISVSK